MFTRPLAALALTVAATLGLSGTAKADNHYAVVGLRNDTNVPLNFTYRWGDHGEWKERTIPAGGRMWFSWTYDYPNENRSPWLYIKVDEDLSDNDSFATYRLRAAAAVGQSYDQGKKHAFRYEPRDRGFIHLVSLDD